MARWWILLFSLLVLVAGSVMIYVSGIAEPSGQQAWPIVVAIVLLSLWLFASGRGEDLFAIQLTMVENGELGRLRSNVPLRQRKRSWQTPWSRRRQTRRLREAIQRERAEAIDAAQVDSILQRMHVSGVEEISAEERQLLQRVSDTIRRQRQRDRQDPHDRHTSS